MGIGRISTTMGEIACRVDGIVIPMDTPFAGAPATPAPTAPLHERGRDTRRGFDAAVSVVEMLLGSPLAAVVVDGEEPMLLTAPAHARTAGAVRTLARHAVTRHASGADGEDAAATPSADADDHTAVAAAIRAGRTHTVLLHDDEAGTLGLLGIADLEGDRPLDEVTVRALDDVAVVVASQLAARCREVRQSVSEARFRNIAATSPDPIMCVNAAGVTTFWNRAAEELFGYSAVDMIGAPLIRIIPERGREEFFAGMERAAAALEGAPLDQRVRAEGMRRDGSLVQVELSLSSWREGDSMAVGAIVRDLTAQLETECRLYSLATTDSLTGLTNRAAVHDALAQRVGRAQPLTFIMIDLDGFKDVNDTLGHTVGDEVLSQAAARIEARVGTGAIVGRLGGDEFVVVVDGDDVDSARALGEGVIAAVSGAYTAKGQQVEIGASAGVAIFPRDAHSAEMLVSAADLAMYRAKGVGRGVVHVYEPSLREDALIQHTLRHELREALAREEFELVYQPQWARDGETLIGAEALIRWNHPARGQLTPADFLDTLAGGPLAQEVGEWVIRTALAQAARWRELIPGFRVAVNLFESQLRSGTLVDTVAQLLRETGLPGDALELELVETILTRDDEYTLEVLRALRNLGVHLAFDDYGTGFASLSLLSRYPVSRLKIDRTFVRGVDSDDENAAIVLAVLYLASMFGLDVIAEGIETEKELAFLRGANCAFYQGYHLGRPMAVADFARACLPSTPTV